MADENVNGVSFLLDPKRKENLVRRLYMVREDQDRFLDNLSMKTGRSKSEIIRELVDHLIHQIREEETG